MKINAVLFLLLCISIMATSSCAVTDTDANQMVTSVDTDITDEFEEFISSWDIDSNNNAGVQTEFVVDEKLALDIGNAVIKSVYNEEVLSQTDFTVYEINDKDMFIVNRSPKGGETLGGDYNVAINKKNGAIMKIWAGE